MSAINKGSYKYRLLERCIALQDNKGVVDGNKLRRSLIGKERTSLSAAITQLTKAGFITKQGFAKGDYNLTLTFHSVTQFMPGLSSSVSENVSKHLEELRPDLPKPSMEDIPAELADWLECTLELFKGDITQLISLPPESIKSTLVPIKQNVFERRTEARSIRRNSREGDILWGQMSEELKDFAIWLEDRQ